MYVYLSVNDSISIHTNDDPPSTEPYVVSSSSIISNEDLSLQVTVSQSDAITYNSDEEPLLMLINAARQSNTLLVQQASGMFMDHVNQVIEISHRVCSFSNQPRNIEQIHSMTLHLKHQSLKFVEAAEMLIKHGTSAQALESIQVLRTQWQDDILHLTELIDQITSIEDLLAITENKVLEDIDRCVNAIGEKNFQDHGVDLECFAHAIQRRSYRIIDVVLTDLQGYQSKKFVKTILTSVDHLKQQILPDFVEQTKMAINILQRQYNKDDPEYETCEEEFIRTSNHIYHALRDIRNSLSMDAPAIHQKMNLSVDDQDDQQALNSSSSSTNHNSSIYEIVQQPESSTGSYPDQLTYISKLNDYHTEIMVFARKIGLIVMDMTDFSRGRGVFNSSIDFMNATKELSHLGMELNQLAKDFANQCTEPDAKSDLWTYIDRISLYCHQLDVTRRVKADLQSWNQDENLDDVSTLMGTANNLINAVVLLVQAAYIASTKSRSKEAFSSWNRCFPKKQSCSSLDRPSMIEFSTNSKTGSNQLELLRILNEFTELQQNSIEFQ